MDYYSTCLHFILFILLSLIKPPTSLCANDSRYTSCGTEFACESLRYIKYPFWGGNRPDFCGKQGYKLDCVNETTVISIKSLNYTVIDVDYRSHFIKVARMDYLGNICRPSILVSTAIDFTLFNYTSGTQNLTLGYGCPLHHPGDAYLDYPCTINNTRTNIVVNPSIECNQTISIPVFDNVVSDLELGRIKLGHALDRGFTLEWYVESELCKNCILSNGSCGIDDYKSFICYCPDGSSSQRGCGIRPGSSKKGPATITIILPTIAAILIIVAIAWGIFICKQRKKRRTIKEVHAAQTESKAILTTVSSKRLTSDSQSMFASSISSYASPIKAKEFGKCSYFGAQVFSYEELEVSTDNFNDSRELGDGGYGTVYHGILFDGREVAVKRLYENNFKRVEQFMNEVEILTRLDHVNLVKLYGCTSKRSRELLLVYEYISNGTVADHLHGKLAKPNSGLFTWPVRFNIAVETAEALTYLHNSDIIHRDVKTTNILLDKNFRVKVADFGLSRLFPNNATHVSTAPQGTPGYVDPDYYLCYQLTDKSDVYSFGVVLIELISSLQAVDTNRDRLDINLAAMAINKIQNHRLDELVDKSIGFETNALVRRMITLVAELAFLCLQQESDMRPTMKEVLEILRGIQNDELNAQKPEVLHIVMDDGVLFKDHGTEPTSPEYGVTKKLYGSYMPNSSDD